VAATPTQSWPVITTTTSATIGGVVKSRVMSLATTNATSVKAIQGNIYGLKVYNTNASTRYFKLYDKTSAPTVGTDTPIITIPIAPSSWAPVLEQPIPFTNGIAYAITGAVADSDTTAVSANDVVGTIIYQ
jgi:hypothetical protein